MEESRLAGLAHVATISFVAARIAPPIGFGVALAGGLALARAGQRAGLRKGYGAGLGTILETVAIVGPTRLGGAISQAITAPALGRMERLRIGAAAQVVICASMRFAYNAVTTAFFIWVLAGGLPAYAGTYDSAFGGLPLLPSGPAAALIATAIALLAWASFAAIVQVGVFRRGLRRWPEHEPQLLAGTAAPAPDAARHGFDRRGIAAASVVAFALLIGWTAWPLLAAVAAWLGLAWLLAPPERHVVPAGLVLATALGASALLVAGVGGSGWAAAAAHAVRAWLLVMTATWMRGAAGEAGFREVTQRVLRRLGRVPSVPEALAALDQLGLGRRLGAAARSLIGAVGSVRRRPLAIVDSVLAWVGAESARFRTVQAEAGPALLRRAGRGTGRRRRPARVGGPRGKRVALLLRFAPFLGGAGQGHLDSGADHVGRARRQRADQPGDPAVEDLAEQRRRPDGEPDGGEAERRSERDHVGGIAPQPKPEPPRGGALHERHPGDRAGRVEEHLADPGGAERGAQDPERRGDHHLEAVGGDVVAHRGADASLQPLPPVAHEAPLAGGTISRAGTRRIVPQPREAQATSSIPPSAEPTASVARSLTVSASLMKRWPPNWSTTNS